MSASSTRASCPRQSDTQGADGFVLPRGLPAGDDDGRTRQPPASCPLFAVICGPVCAWSLGQYSSGCTNRLGISSVQCSRLLVRQFKTLCLQTKMGKIPNTNFWNDPSRKVDTSFWYGCNLKRKKIPWRLSQATTATESSQ